MLQARQENTNELIIEFGQHEFYPRWAAEQLKIDRSYFGECSTISIFRGKKLVAVAVYSSFNGVNCEFSLAAISMSWIRKPIIKILAAYPFKSLGCRRLTFLVREHNQKVKRLADRLHFKQEGFLREFYPDGGGCYVYGVTHKDYIEVTHGV